MHSEMILFETQQRPEGYRIFGTEAGAYTAYHSLSPDGFSPDNSVGRGGQPLCHRPPRAGL